MNKQWAYKRFCRRCGELRFVNGKYGRFCFSCTLPKRGESEAYKKLLKKRIGGVI